MNGFTVCFSIIQHLIKRQIPAVILRILYNMYVSHVACVDWNGVHSSVFSVINGVKQGGIISPILFCIYIDDLLSGLVWPTWASDVILAIGILEL